jgi:hypothetical protein
MLHDWFAHPQGFESARTLTLVNTTSAMTIRRILSGGGSANDLDGWLGGLGQ